MKDNVMKSISIVKYDGDSFQEIQDHVATEYALTIIVNDDEFATMVCTPTYMEDLVTGFLASEGVIRLPREIESLSIDEDRGFAYVQLLDKKPVTNQLQSKRFIGSCCGKSRQFYFQSDVKNAKTIMSKATIQAEQCISLMKAMQDSSDDFHSTGGLHNAALCTNDELLISRSDIGRHNALDKIYGHCLKNNIALGDKVIAFSGRISSEVLLKVSKIGAGIILSKSAPTTLALELANDLGITAVGFIRGSRLNVYTHPERIIV
ncbi:formate dehydrogenase accessory sulfurtransferase FdhD [Fictibacillus sp. KU28468]|uniref:formate dehydrogenase accessory sulfurtransferase FdhD n=1 Tax=Fictibacillus sp. KU28468 TaxID=2991053 RepID=UPI00223D254D|nr:formate dehydrogenase accessory sulfurtransferase FdhD [Fictibacillus sp. KU28468]UZJ78470.1 formate dehydrogenase accessory sulfurtransferase FdhD [Fictibacillus sp. KU28468]